MRSTMTSRATLMLAAAMAGMAFAPAAGFQNAATRVLAADSGSGSVSKALAQKASTASDTQGLRGREPNPVTRSRGPNGPGWSNRQVQRMARKRRNVQRNRAAHRGGK